MLTKRDLNRLLKQFPANAKIQKSDILITVSAPDDTKVLSAAKMQFGLSTGWHVRAIEGLVEIKPTDNI